MRHNNDNYKRQLHRNLSGQSSWRRAARIIVVDHFYYNRDGRRGVCVFIDGPSHESKRQWAKDTEVREELEDLGFTIVAIRHDAPLSSQIAKHENIFGTQSRA